MSQDLPTMLLRETPGRAPSGFGLPSELLAKSRTRLGKFVLFITIVLVAVTVLVRLAPVDWGIDPDTFGRVYVAQSVLVAAHLGLYWVIRSRRFRNTLVLKAGLAYEVLLCLTTFLGDQWLNYTRSGAFHDTTFANLIIVVYPLIIPSPPRTALISSLTAAATIPLGLAILGRLGAPPTAAEYTIGTIGAVISAAIAVFGSRVVHGMNVDVAKARELGSYRLRARLGSGGMGEVWRADHRLLARPAAVKLVRPEVLGAGSGGDAERVLQRFEREAQATAMMRSPHTIQLYDFGVSDEGTFYYVMELLDGLDLQSLVERHGPLPAERVVHLLLQMCDSLAEAHENDLIHRDVKPANVYVCRYGRRVDFVKVLDFGLVKPSGEGGDPGLTQENVVGGTPAFMAPEQILGNHPVDARTDIYALGCVAYWLLAGRLVFEGDTAMETMMHHAHSPPPPLSGQAEVPVPAGLEETVRSCLEKSPADRPPSADSLAEALRACEVEDVWTTARARHWWETHAPKGAAG